MLTRLRTALSFAPAVEFLGYEDGLLTVRSKKALKFDDTSVKLKMSAGTAVAKVLVESYDPSNDVYRLRVLENLGFKLEMREEPRLAKVVRVTSQYFPGFTGTTEDISVSGLRVATRGRLETGREIPLVLELDDDRIPPLSLKAVVVWSADKLNGKFHSGLRITELSSEAALHIKKYIQSRFALKKRLHTLEEIDPSEIM